MAPDPLIPDPDAQNTMSRKDWVVAVALALVLVLIIAAIFRNGLAYLLG